MAKKQESNFQRIHNSIEKIPRDKIGLVASVGLFLLMSLLFYQQFLWWSGDKIAIPIPGMMSIVPAYNIDATYEETFDEGDSLTVTLNLCSSFEPICVPCQDCSADLYYDYGKGKQIYEKNIMLTNGTTTIQIRTIPTWLYVGFNGTYYNYIRIPDPSTLDYIIESSQDFTNKLTFFVTWSWLITVGITIFSIFKHGIKYVKNKIKKHKEMKNRPEYIG